MIDHEEWKVNTKAEPSKRMKRGSYREAIRWIAENDDTVWVDDVNAYGPADLSVTATLIADLFDVEHERVRVDIRRELDKYRRLADALDRRDFSHKGLGRAG